MRNVFSLDFAEVMKDLYEAFEFLTNVIHLKKILILLCCGVKTLSILYNYSVHIFFAFCFWFSFSSLVNLK